MQEKMYDNRIAYSISSLTNNIEEKVSRVGEIWAVLNPD